MVVEVIVESDDINQNLMKSIYSLGRCSPLGSSCACAYVYTLYAMHLGVRASALTCALFVCVCVRLRSGTDGHAL